MLRRAVVLFVGVAATAGAGCGWMFPDDRDVPDGVREVFAEMTQGPLGQDCEVLVDRIREVASVPDPGGGQTEFVWFIAPTDGGGQWEFVFELDDAGNDVGGAGGGGGCEAVPGRDADGLWWSGGSGSDSEVVHGGHAPEGTRSVRLYFDDDEPVIVDVNADGYFLVVLNESACCEWSFPDRIEALDADGEVIDSTRP